MKNDLLAYRHIGISEKDEEKMLQKIGVKSLDELIDKTIPANIRLKEPLALPKTMTEYEFGQHIAGLAAKNKLYTTYIGMGWSKTKRSGSAAAPDYEAGELLKVSKKK